MNRTDAPVKQSTPFAVNGQREPILPTTPAGDNTASYSDGFPAITMILKSAGGLPPKGQDMNQILFELSALARWASSGATNAWDAAFSTAIGGYPMGAVVLGTDGITQYKSTADSNTTNPNTGGAGWFNLTAGYLKTANNLGEIAAAGQAAVAATLANIGLGKVAALGTNGYIQLSPVLLGGALVTPILQWLRVDTNSAGTVIANLPIPYPNQLLFGFASERQPTGWGAGTATSWGFDSVNSNAAQISAYVKNIQAGSVMPATAAGIVVTLGY